MQFHLNGFHVGDPHVAKLDHEPRQSDALPETLDVLIVGCGPAGLTLAAQMARFPDISTRIVEAKDGPLELGQADGVACRSMEMFQAFGFAEKLEKEAYWVNEVAFWKPDAENPDRIVRSGRIQDVEDGLSEFPHVILNQARVHEFYLEQMRNSASRLTPDYSRRLLDLTVGEGTHPVTVRLERTDPDHAGEIEAVRAKYVVGCDGARSAVRASLGGVLKGDAANQAWGVMDVLAVTDFPDIRLKNVIQSKDGGSIVLIPREGGYLVRIYVELDELAAHERVKARNITLDQMIGAAQKVFHPYSLEVKDVAWWSVYEIGQRLTDKFDDVPPGEDRAPHVFIAGDACHTHSPKAGQGMNVSMQDTFNLGWKLAAVLRDQAAPEFLHTYSAERQAIAKTLIDFDREWAKMLSAPLKDPNDPESEGVDPQEVQAYFQQHGRYTAGTATVYAPSVLTGDGRHQQLAQGFQVGTRFHSAPVVRLGDAKRMHLGHVHEADGRWRLYAFADGDHPAAEGSGIARLCDALATAPDSPVVKYTPKAADPDAVFDLRAIFQQPYRDLDVEAMPEMLKPRKGKFGLKDYEKMFCPDLKHGPDIFDARGIDRSRGAIVVVRPDQYVATVLPLDGYAELAAYFDGFLTAAVAERHLEEA
ncbi:FAD-binding monooxygenase [Psychromarinibacter sp. C21-152]|uniref:FAD-binding monooxygenase n=1 Tax=Psychromarinibacter sediminicola TaxID=3033385 RepID=A0AAE3T8H6_9RHOB|nr:FAD-binding monooxygenase [Psychromarinibacter sediminicola]MDF0600713.1 FAD-binding monooxygenase [Psychromarinibacter sediminicola]